MTLITRVSNAFPQRSKHVHITRSLHCTCVYHCSYIIVTSYFYLLLLRAYTVYIVVRLLQYV